MFYPEISIYRYEMLSTFVSNNRLVKQADSNFLCDQISGKGSFEKLPVKVYAPKEECTHISISGVSVLRNRKYPHTFEYEINNYPEIKNWVIDYPWKESDNSPLYIGRSQIVSKSPDSYPKLIQSILKAISNKNGDDYNDWMVKAGTHSQFYEDMFPFIVWGSNLNIKPLYYIED